MGDMSFVGPRPNLFNQTELIEERQKRGAYDVRPGITGLAQINKIDMSTPLLLAETDAMMVAQFDVWYYFKYIFLTVFGKGFGDRIVQQK
jgi:lipopolysaccharide/colanic/teichoic acid biosynthesis glycosyltransferase